MAIAKISATLSKLLMLHLVGQLARLIMQVEVFIILLTTYRPVEMNLLVGLYSRVEGLIQLLSLKFRLASRGCSAMLPGRINLRAPYIVPRYVEQCWQCLRP